jgi:hypothetical protein
VVVGAAVVGGTVDTAAGLAAAVVVGLADVVDVVAHVVVDHVVEVVYVALDRCAADVDSWSTVVVVCGTSAVEASDDGGGAVGATVVGASTGAAAAVSTGSLWRDVSATMPIGTAMLTRSSTNSERRAGLSARVGAT